jgi:hypothetical protein
VCKFSHTYLTILFQGFVHRGRGSGTVGVAPRKKLNESSHGRRTQRRPNITFSKYIIPWRGRGGSKFNRLNRCAEIEHITQNDVDWWWKQIVRTFSKQQPFLAVVWWKYLGKEKQFRLPEIEGAGMMLNTVAYSTLLQIAVISAIMFFVKKNKRICWGGNYYYYSVITSSTSVR